MRLLGHPGSDLDETWWKLFPGVSRSFLNSSGTKITAQNNQKRQTNFKRKIRINQKGAEISKWRFSDMRRCALGGFRPVEFESEVENCQF